MGAVRNTKTTYSFHRRSQMVERLHRLAQSSRWERLSNCCYCWWRSPGCVHQCCRHSVLKSAHLQNIVVARFISQLHAVKSIPFLIRTNDISARHWWSPRGHVLGLDDCPSVCLSHVRILSKQLNTLRLWNYRKELSLLATDVLIGKRPSSRRRW